MRILITGSNRGIGLEFVRLYLARGEQVIATCDNLFTLYLNGHGAGESQANNSAWGKPKRFDVSRIIVPGRNVVAVEGVNTIPGPAPSDLW